MLRKRSPGRFPLGDQAMTAAERQKRYRERRKAQADGAAKALVRCSSVIAEIERLLRKGDANRALERAEMLRAELRETMASLDFDSK